MIYLGTSYSNGKLPVATSQELSGKGIRKVDSNCIFTHKLKTYKNLNLYSVTEKAFSKIAENNQITKVYGI